jgi:hypothetical protein
MREAQMGQLDPSRVSIATDPDGGKLIDGPICCYRKFYAMVDLDVRSSQIQ